MNHPEEAPRAESTEVALRRLLDAVSHRLPRDTSGHLDRMACYARLIAARIARSHGLSASFVDVIFHCAPLHDIGKAAIPNAILLKPEGLTPDERRVMDRHVEKGVRLVNLMIDRFQLGSHPDVVILRNIVAAHHELLDGSGYPQGLSGEAIPLEARIVTVADIFDALTSRRSYKQAWHLDDALRALETLATEGKVDTHCVAALVDGRDECGEIIRRHGG